LEGKFYLRALKDLIEDGHVLHAHGDYVPKIYYGTGPYPYIRTSDLANWEIKASPKHGVPEGVYLEYSPGQQVMPGDILFVHEGTYLIGSVAMVTKFDGPFLYQHHLAKFSVTKTSPFDAYYLLAAFQSPLVNRQIRSKQFSADIIDSVVGRLDEVIVPYPKDKMHCRTIGHRVERAILGRAQLREKIAHFADSLDLWLRGSDAHKLKEIFEWFPSEEVHRSPSLLGGRPGFVSTVLRSDQVANDVLLPRYYDPWVNETAKLYARRCDLVTLQDLIEIGKISLQTGDEIGRLNYGTGKIPFVRTSDFGSWELLRESKQGVSDEVYEIWRARQDVRPGDILIVRDGSYLIGTSVLLQPEDMPILYCGGIYKIRCFADDFEPGLLFALLNSSFVKRQIRNKQFTRDVIDTLGHRLKEVILPVPKDQATRKLIAGYFATSIAERARLRYELQDITNKLFDA
jgi:hypothetical protein